MILLADSDGPGQTAWLRRLIWTFADRICQDRFSDGAPQFMLHKNVTAKEEHL